MKRTVFSVKKGLTRSVACLLAAVMLLCAPAASLPAEVGGELSLQTEGSETAAEDVSAEAEKTSSADYVDEPDWLNGSNWMSGISDDRRLNEINIPGTHDSGCASVWGYEGYQDWFESGAVTQKLTLSRQLESGVRLLDLRWTNCISHVKNPDPDDLFQCHGGYQAMNLDGLYYCKEGGHLRSFEVVMEDIKQFLITHPTETVIVSMKAEYDDVKRYKKTITDDIEKITKAVNNHTDDQLPDYLKDALSYYIERSRNSNPLNPYEIFDKTKDWREYIYKRNYSVFATLKPKLEAYSDIIYKGSTIPTLGQARGKAVVLVDGDPSLLGCGFKVHCENKTGTLTAGGVDFVYQNCWDLDPFDKSLKEYEFLEKYNTGLPEAGEHTSRGYINYSSSSKVPFGAKPNEIANLVNPVLYLSPDADASEFWLNKQAYKIKYAFKIALNESKYEYFGQYGLFSERGRHFGWVYSDFVTQDMARMLWLTNFPGGIRSCTVTYKNGEEVFDTQRVPAGGESTLRMGPAVAEAPQVGYGFTGWKDAETGAFYPDGSSAVFEKDAVLEAQWEMTWRSLAEGIHSIEQTSYDSTVIQLPHDLVAEDDDDEISICGVMQGEYVDGEFVQEERPVFVTIDLNGHTLDANAKDGGRARRIFRVAEGSRLTLIDSSGSGSGVLTGGREENGGAILVDNAWGLSMENITIRGNHADGRGGAVCARGYSELALKDVSIVENTAAKAGAGVFVEVDNILKVEGNVRIHENTLKGQANPSLEGAESNIYLDNARWDYNTNSAPLIEVSGPLDPDSEIGVSIAKGPIYGGMGQGPVRITNGLYGNGSVNSFRSDLNKYEVENRYGEAFFSAKLQTVNYDPNGATSGTVPMDPNTYDIGDVATVLGNTGDLAWKGHGSFDGWNTEPDGSGTAYSAGDSITIQGSVTLYAQWVVARVTTPGGDSTNYPEFTGALEAWRNGSTLTLLGDVETDATISIFLNSQDGLILDLNGYGITMTQKGSVLNVGYGRTLTMVDSAPDRTGTGEGRPEGVAGGYITGGYGSATGTYGGGVHVYGGTFNMEGGTITGNRSTDYGGGVYNIGTFNMSGGAVTGNHAGSRGGGVYVQSSATFTVSGSARVENNTQSVQKKAGNVYLRSGSAIAVDELGDGARFGVGMEEPGVFTTGASFADDAQAQAVFASDSDAHIVRRTDDGEGTLWQKEPVTYTDHTVEGTAATAVERRCEGYTVLGAGVHEEAITLADGWFVVMDDVTAEKRITVSGTVNLILCDGATLNANKGIAVNAGDTLNLYPGSMGGSVAGTGALTTGFCDDSAGIGGDPRTDGGMVAIHGGEISATGSFAAGIGGGCYGEGGTVVIYGGTVRANGGTYAAGIGGGYKQSGGDVTVYGGTVIAIRGSEGAGIGGGRKGDGGTVAVYGGTVITNATGPADFDGVGIGKGTGGSDHGTLILGEGMYLYGADTAHPESDTVNNHIPQVDGDYVRKHHMTVNSEPPHEHVIVYSMLEDGVTILARCATEGCELHDHPSTLTVTAPTETVENEAGETEETYPVYDGTAKYAGVVVDGRVDLWSDVLITYQRKDPDTGEWTEMPKITRLVDSMDEATGELIDEEALDGLPIDAGKYMALVGFWNEDGQLVAAGVEFTIRQRPLTVTAVDQTVLSIDQISEGHSRIRTGDGELLEGHDVLGFTLTPSPNDEGATEGDIVPSEVVVWDDREQADVTANYAITCVNGKFHVRNAPASVKAAPKAVEDLVYDGGPQALVTAGTAEGGTMRYALGADEATAPSGGWEDAIPTGTGAGTYYIWYMASGDDAHTDTEPAGPVPVTIGPRTAQLAWDHTALTYSGSAQAPTAKVSNLAGGSEWIDSCEVTVEGAQTAPGSYTATATGLSNANYALPEQNTVDFTIEKAAGTIAFGEGSVSKQYGDEAFTNELTNTGDGRVTYASDDTAVATVDEATGEVTIAGIGTATVTATAEDSANCGYEAKTAAFTLTVSPKAAQIQFAQASVNKPFGSSPFVNALTNTGDGEVSYASSDETVATVDAASGRVKVNAAGEATITATAADGATSSYAQKTASFRLTVRKADNPGYAAGSDQVAKGGNKVSLVDHVKKAEGRLTWSISGEALGCTVDENGTFTSGDETGEVTVTVTMSGNDNYIQKTIDLKVSVVEGKTTRRFASSFSRTYGDPLDLPISIPIPESATPEIKYTGTLRGGAPYAESDQAPTETGDYTATVTYEDEQYNWIETLTFNILPRQLGKPEVRLGDALTYNSSEQTQQVAAVIWNGDVVPAAEYTVTDNTGTDAGTYTLTITAKDTGNYTGSVTHEFTIGKANAVAATVTANSRTYDGTEKPLVTVTGEATGGEMQYALGTETEPTQPYTTSIPAKTDARTYYVWYMVKGDNNHKDSTPAYTSVTISPASIADAVVTLNTDTLPWSGSAQSVSVSSVMLGETTLTVDTDYKVTDGTTGTDIKTYTVTITGKGNYKDTANATWNIVPKDMTVNAEDVTVSYDEKPYGISVNVTDPASGYVIKYGTVADGCTLDESPTITNAAESPFTVYYKVTATNYNDKTGSATVTINKADRAAPAAPTKESVTGNSITLTAVDGCEYRIGEDGTWQGSTTFSGLTVSTDYSFYQRYKEDANHNASPASEAASIRTNDHVHEWEYQASGATLTATCKNTDGGHGTPLTAALTINAPTLTTYGETGKDANASITGSIAGVTNPDIVYKKGGETLNAAPTGAGTYTANITLGEGDDAVTASVQYTIAQATLTNVSVEQNGTITYTGSAQTPQVTTAATAVNDQTVTFTYSKTQDGEYSSTMPTVTNVSDSGTIYYMASAPNHGAATGSFTVTVNPATLTNVSVEQNGTITYTGSAQTPQVTTAATAVNDQTVTFTYSKTQDGEYSSTMPTVTNVSDSGTIYYKASAPNHGAATGSFTVTVQKADHTAPAAPTKASATINSITLAAIENGQYKRGDGEWTDNPNFDGLTMNSAYDFYQRLKGDENHNASPASIAASIRTNNHIHSWSYQANGATLTATCKNTDGGHGTPLTAALTINAPVLTTYGETDKDANATITGSIDGVTNPDIVYKKGSDTLDSAPTDAGTYIASITLGEATASVQYTIAQATATIKENPTASEITYGQKLANSNLTGGTASVAGTFTWKDSTVAPAVSDSQTTEYDVVFTPADGNYGTAGCKVKLTVKKANGAITKAPEAKTLTYTGSAQALVTAGTATGGEIQYALGTATEAIQPYTTSIPTKTDAGTYYVWYKVAGDSNHLDTDPVSLIVMIAAPPATPGPDETPTPPITPVKVEIRYVANCDKGADIRWKKAAGADGYIVYCGRKGEGYRKVATIHDPNVLQCYDTKVRTSWGRVYHYFVCGIYGNKTGPQSEKMAFVRLAPMKITGLKTTKPGTVRCTYACIVPANATDGYVLEYAASKEDLKQKSGTYGRVYVKGRDALAGTIKGLENRTTWYFRVRAYKDYTNSASGKKTRSWSAYSKTASLYVTDSPEPAYQSTDNVRNSREGITVYWKESSNADGYVVLRKDSKQSPWELIARVKGRETRSYLDTSVKDKNGREYIYTVRGTLGSKLSAYNKEGKSIVRLRTPGLQILSAKAGTVSLKWDRNGAAMGYEIEYSTNKQFKNGQGGQVKKVSPGSVTTAKIGGLDSDETYYFRIRSYRTQNGAVVYSGWSAAKAVQP